jgi:hypothetical protein
MILRKHLPARSQIPSSPEPEGLQKEDKVMRIIDSHIHCGVQNVQQPYGRIAPLLEAAGITAACLFAPVEDIYYRYDRRFDDNRQRAHDYLLDVAETNAGIYPYYFVWNDFCIADLNQPFRGIKWHHHAGEPPYRYDDPRCTAMIDAICRRRLPVVLEETFERTLWFIERVAGRTPVIIPHLGLLNGGFGRLLAAGVWELDSVYADTALAGAHEVAMFLKRYGSRRLLFGSDFPFGHPADELATVKQCGLDEAALRDICGQNIARLIGIETH